MYNSGRATCQPLMQHHTKRHNHTGRFCNIGTGTGRNPSGLPVASETLVSSLTKAKHAAIAGYDLDKCDRNISYFYENIHNRQDLIDLEF